MKKMILLLTALFIFISPLSSVFAACTVIKPGAQFTPGKRYFSPNKQVFLVLQGDGNFVLYQDQTTLCAVTGVLKSVIGECKPYKPLWHTRTDIGLQTRAYFQGDGNLVVYYNATALWDSGTWGNNDSRLLIDDKGHLRIINNAAKVIWRSN